MFKEYDPEQKQCVSSTQSREMKDLRNTRGIIVAVNHFVTDKYK